ncbi:hypothetical protein GCM10017750_26130 [Streptomyces racemochromogenes]
MRGDGEGCCGWLSDIALLRWLGRFLCRGRSRRPKITQRAPSLGRGGPGFAEERNSRTGVAGEGRSVTPGTNGPFSGPGEARKPRGMAGRALRSPGAPKDLGDRLATV